MSAFKRVLLTGASGFVGACLARRLLKDGHEVHLLLRKEAQTWRLKDINNQLQIHGVGVEDSAGLKGVMKRVSPNWVFHLAAHGAYSNQTSLEQMLSTNVHGMANLVHAALGSGVEVLVNAGSSSEYGLKDHPPKENEWLEPNSPYAITKAFATHFCRYMSQKEGLPMPTLRLYSVYGAYEEPTRLIPTLLMHALRGSLPPLVDPAVARDFVHVEDVCDAFIKAASTKLEDPGAVFNIATGVQTSLSEVVATARRLFNVEKEPVWGSMPNRQWDATVWVGDPTQAQTVLGWKAKRTLEQGLKLTADWLESHSLRSLYERQVFPESA